MLDFSPQDEKELKQAYLIIKKVGKVLDKFSGEIKLDIGQGTIGSIKFTYLMRTKRKKNIAGD